MTRITEEEIASLIASGKFDSDWYIQEYPDVAMTGLRPEEHFLWIGRSLNRRGSPKALSTLTWAPLQWGVMTTPHTLFLANMVASNLRRHGWAVDVVTEAPESFPHDFYIVLCPQMFELLPPGDKRICYQLEQSVSSRWFTKEYFSILENSLCAFDYSLNNIEFLAENGVAYPHMFYLPVGALDVSGLNNRIEKKKYDILFYGDYKSSERRRRFIDAASQKFNIKLIDDSFGDAMHALIKQSKYVLNIHYYEGALLETPRIQECLSLGTPVISESTNDVEDYSYLKDAVTFFEEGSCEDMERVIALALAAEQKEDVITASVASSQRVFEFMFDRFLVAQNFLPLRCVDDIRLPDIFDGRMVSLSLPETVNRRRIFEAEKIPGCSVFDGMRKSPGWIGCGMSYKVLCAGALERNKKHLVVVEDDVILDDKFEKNFSTVLRYLDKIEKWDIFSGVIASLHDEAEVSCVENFEGIDFVTINKMTSMVFNIYNESAMRLIADWSPINSDVESNAIDRYLENSDLKIVVAHPYIAGHREEVHSTLWGFKNTQYVDMIQESQDRLGDLKRSWLLAQEDLAA